MLADVRAVETIPGELVSLARELALTARRETLPRFAKSCAPDNKAVDGAFDPVTEADRSAELAMRALIAKRFPNHGVSGEEFGDTPGQGALSWSLDPVDGTRSFICGLPTWVTLAALLDDGEPIMGLIDAPCLDELYLGVAGETTGERAGRQTTLTTSGCTSLAGARLSTTDPYLFEGAQRSAFDRLHGASRTVRFGHDGYAYARLAAGSLDLVVECGLKPHDYNALIPVVRGAGGVIGDWRGGNDFAVGNIIAAATPELFDAAVAVMRKSI